MVIFGWDHDCCHDSGNVEVGPGEHLFEYSVDSEVVTVAAYSVFHWDTALVVDRFVGIAVIIGLNEEPGGLVEFVDGMWSFWVTFDDHTLSDSSDNKVDRSGNVSVFESLCGSCVGALFFKDFVE